MKGQRLRKALVRLIELIQYKIDSPNYGGCGVIALTTARALDSIGVPYKIWGSGGPVEASELTRLNDPSNWGSSPMNGQRLREELGCGMRHHVFLTIKIGRWWYVWDSDHRPYLDNGPAWHVPGCVGVERSPVPLSLYLLDALVSDVNAWNCRFNRSQIPTIQSLVTEAFEL